jgi:hypothetical protein
MFIIIHADLSFAILKCRRARSSLGASMSDRPGESK